MVAAAVVGGAVIGGVASNQAAKKGAKAAGDAADAQSQSARDSIAYQRESRDLARSDLAPFVNFATGSVDQYDPQNYANLPYAETEDNFDAQAYLAANPDVASGWNTSDKSVFDHYLMYGKNEGRKFTARPGATRAGASGGSVADPNSPIAMMARLLTPTGQYDYLQNNPLFKAAVDNANRATIGINAARGKLGSGDTLKSLSQNTLLAAQPLLGQQQNALFNAINIGQSSAAGQANNALQSSQSIGNTLTDIGNAQAAGIIGASNARTSATNSLLNAGVQLGGAYLGGAFNQPNYAGMSSDTSNLVNNSGLF